MVDYLVSTLKFYGDREILLEGSKRIMSSQFIADIERSCSFWKHSFAGGGHHIGIVAENSYLWLVQCMGIIASGNTVVAFNYNLGEEELIDFIELSDTEIALCDDGMLHEYTTCGERISFLELSQAFCEIPVSFTKRSEDDVIMMYFSSGTSGKSKIVQLRNKGMMIYGDYYLNVNERGSKTVLIALPLHHVGGIFNSYDELLFGNRIVISSAKYLLRDLRRIKVTKIVLVPSMLRNIFTQIQKGNLSKEQLSGVKEIYYLGAPLFPGMYDKVRQLGMRLQANYGLTEVTRGISGAGPYRENSVGRVEPYAKVKIEEGEILAGGEGMMLGYYRNPVETNKVCQNGWLHTGDMGRMDEDGYLYITGRKKNIIILANGDNVSPEELEDKLYGCPLISECRVYGSDDKITAEIYTCPDEKKFEERKSQIENYIKKLNTTLPTMKRIGQIYIKESELSKTAMGKIKRN